MGRRSPAAKIPFPAAIVGGRRPGRASAFLRKALFKENARRSSDRQIGFRPDGRDVHAAVEQAIDQRADNFRAVQHLAALRADIRRKPVEVVNLSIEEND